MLRQRVQRVSAGKDVCLRGERNRFSSVRCCNRTNLKMRNDALISVIVDRQRDAKLEHEKSEI